MPRPRLREPIPAPSRNRHSRKPRRCTPPASFRLPDQWVVRWADPAADPWAADAPAAGFAATARSSCSGYEAAMPIAPYASWMLEQEARALLTRLARVRPFAMQETMLPAAGLLPSSQVAIEGYLMRGRRSLRRMVHGFLKWLRTAGQVADAAAAQRRFAIIRLRFLSVLTQFDLFNEVITQRSESETGVWLSGLDVVSADALRLRHPVFDVPPVICYLDRNPGAAI